MSIYSDPPSAKASGHLGQRTPESPSLKSDPLPMRKLYTRQFSNVVRRWSSADGWSMHENPVMHLTGPNRVIVLNICRIRQRILSAAWQTWTKKMGVQHDFEPDVRLILSRKIPGEDLRTELEVEVLHKWIEQVKDKDPTGIASTIFHCRSKAVIYEALQQLRLEFYAPGETLLVQGDVPRAEDGHFTVFRGDCEVVQFPDESVPLLKLLYHAKKKRWDEVKTLLRSAQVVAKIPRLSGFGELSTLTGVKRAASIRASRKLDHPLEVLVLPKEPLLNCLQSKFNDVTSGSTTSEAIDFLRQSGLANRISPKDLVEAASSMIRRTLLRGDVLYYKGETVRSIFLVVSGEFLLDTADCLFEGVPEPFAHSTQDKCFHLSSGSILGDEGVTGYRSVFESTAAVVSSAAVVFEAVGFGMRFLADKIGTLRYSALFYRDKLRFDYSNEIAEQMNIYTYFNSLRKCIACTKPFRGTLHSSADLLLENSTRSASPKTALHRASSHFIEDRVKSLQSKDSRVSFLLDNEAENASEKQNNDNECIVYNAPRVLVGLGLHRAIEMNKTAKKQLEQGIKLNAKDTILYEQLRKIPKEDDDMDEEEDADRVHAMKILKKSLREYFERVAERNRRIKEEEEAERQRKLARGASAVSFFNAMSHDDEGSAGTHKLPSIVVEKQEDDLRKASTVSFDSLSSNLSRTHARIRMSVVDHQISKIEQYFVWVDSLNRQNYRHLLHQAQITAVELHNEHVHEDVSILRGGAGRGFTEESMQQLADVFKNFGLTPTDMGIPWQSPSMSAAASRVGTSSAKLRPVTPLLPLQLLRSSSSLRSISADSLPPSIHQDNKEQSKKPKSNSKKPASNKLTKKTVAFENPHVAITKDDRHGIAKMESKFKTYTPSSWRDDLIQKKAQELSQMQDRFMRFDTPDNRRTLDLHIKVHLHESMTEENDLQLNGDATVNTYKKKAASKKEVAKDPQDDLDVEKYLEDPQYYLNVVLESDFSQKNRIKATGKPWETRFMNIKNAQGGGKKPLPVVDSVRTHLRENLDEYSKTALLQSVNFLHKGTRSDADSMDDASDLVDFFNSCTRRPTALNGSQIETILRQFNETSPAKRMTQDLNESLKSEAPLAHEQASLLAADNNEHRGETLQRNPSIGGQSLSPSASFTLPMLNTSSRVDMLPLSPSPSGFLKSTSRRMSQTDLKQTLPAVTEPPKRISDLKQPSKALEAFESFLRSEQNEGKAKIIQEGRKRANQSSKFRLHQEEPDPFAPTRGNQTYKQLFETEMALFAALHPKASVAKKKAFIDSFMRKYPEANIEALVKPFKEDNPLQDAASVNNSTIFSLGSQSESTKIHSKAAIDTTAVEHEKGDEDDEDPEFTRWQQYTLNSLVQAKNGERKEFPTVSLKKMKALETLSGKRYRQRTSLGFITFPPKHTEEPMSGPPSYLELYKNGYRIYTNTKDKARVIEDLRARAATEHL